jgi:hypothetical protein
MAQKGRTLMELDQDCGGCRRTSHFCFCNQATVWAVVWGQAPSCRSLTPAVNCLQYPSCRSLTPAVNCLQYPSCRSLTPALTVCNIRHAEALLQQLTVCNIRHAEALLQQLTVCNIHHAEALLQQLTACNTRHFSNCTNFHSSLTNSMTMIQFSSVCKVPGMPQCFTGSSFSAIRPHKVLWYKAWRSRVWYPMWWIFKFT